MIAWKDSFRRLNDEYDVARKKKRALDSLMSSGKISQPTHNMFNREIDAALAEIERQRKVLLEKMSSKMMELEEHVRSLEILIANFEIQHVVGEVPDDIYERESEVLSTGLETARQELEDVKDAADQLSSGTAVTEDEEKPHRTEVSKPEAELPDDQASNTDEEQMEAEETIVEPVQCTEETHSKEGESENKQAT